MKLTTIKRMRQLLALEKKVESLKSVCKIHSVVEIEPGQHSNQYSAVPLYEIARVFDEELNGGVYGRDKDFYDAGWTMFEE